MNTNNTQTPEALLAGLKSTDPEIRKKAMQEYVKRAGEFKSNPELKKAHTEAALAATKDVFKNLFGKKQSVSNTQPGTVERKSKRMWVFLAIGVFVVMIGIAKNNNEVAEAQKAAEIAQQKAAAQQAILDEEKNKQCRKDIQCWGGSMDLLLEVGTQCKPFVEKFAKHNFEWTDSWTSTKITHLRWLSKKRGSITYSGDRVKFQNGFGGFSIMTYECDFDVIDKKILDVRVREGQVQ